MATKGGGRKIVSIREAAEFLRIHPHTLYRMLRRGEIPPGAMRIRGHWRVDLDKLERFLRTGPSTRK
jgi:excisionase family DNA binding protein